MKITVKRKRSPLSAKLAIARRVRRAMEAWRDENDRSGMNGLCALGAWALADAFTAAGYEAEVVFGRWAYGCHFWVRSGRTYWDVTGDQFTWITKRVNCVPVHHADYRRFTQYRARKSICSWWGTDAKPTKRNLQQLQEAQA